MKKVTPLIIAATFVLSILLVGFMGVRGAPFTENIHVSSINIIDDDIQRVSANIYQVMPWTRSEFASIQGTPMAEYVLRWSVYPRNTTTTSVRIVSSALDEGRITVNQQGNQATIRFLTTHTSTTIQIFANDAANRSVELRIFTLLPD